MAIINYFKKFALVLILLGTTILALPAGFGTIALLGESLGSQIASVSWNYLLILSLSGFVLYFGYIITFFTKKHSRIFWAFSFLYNLGLSLTIGYFVVADLISSIVANLSLFAILYLLLPIWTSFVTISSGYYFVNAKSLSANKSVLP